MSLTLRIATRKSPLALWQAEHVRDLLRAQHPGLQVALISMSTQGDTILDTKLTGAGGKGLFTKELEQALLEHRADIAVHSMKDVTVDMPEGLALPVMLTRADPRDAFVSARHDTLAGLPHGARVGTASQRRQSQLAAWRADLQIHTLRGNVGTRLRKLGDGEFDAIILAVAGLERLALHSRIREFIPVTALLPTIGQGAIGIQCRADDAAMQELIAPLNHADTFTCVSAERALNRTLHGGCQVPIAAYAELHEGQIHLRGLVARLDGTAVVRGERRGARADAEAMGIDLAHELLANGARDILNLPAR